MLLIPFIKKSDEEVRPIEWLDQFENLEFPWSEVSEVRRLKDRFEIVLDVQYFSPKELMVKTADGCIIVEGKHEEKKDEQGYISRQFTRRYQLPQGCRAQDVRSRLSSDGILVITCPRSISDITIPVQHEDEVKSKL